MDLTSLGSLVLLALLDSTSFGTLLVPVWLLIAPGRVRFGRVMLFLATVTVMYFGIGLALLLGASALLDVFDSVKRSDGFLVGQLVVGAALVVVSHRMDDRRARERAAQRAAAGTGRIARWREQAMGSERASAGTTASVVALAIAAVATEIATMVPYLAAVGIITTQGPGALGDAALLAGYCLVMILPALILTIGRVLARDALERPLSQLDRWLTRHAQSTAAWVIGIIGVILALRAVYELGWIGG
ncbi:GAP family protein [Microbacterium marinilacus]|uniref:GAP family protein n=1 Tax=Microbacterium marinilacus TaxID=415209 RepID=A0ABP7BMH0_9MICO|nr:GAP family protein [Microbacterium marinilacus]MBY0688387.1 GAP family protein [Microbacterium marinilacus]